MTWSTNASGHHQSQNWEREEYELLQRLVDAYEADDTNVTTSFAFTGNHVSVHSINEAREAIAAWSEKIES